MHKYYNKTSCRGWTSANKKSTEASEIFNGRNVLKGGPFPIDELFGKEYSFARSLSIKVCMYACIFYINQVISNAAYRLMSKKTRLYIFREYM